MTTELTSGNRPPHMPLYGVFRTAAQPRPRVGVALGRRVLDLAALEARGDFSDLWPDTQTVFAQPSLNAFLALGRPAWDGVQQIVSRLLPGVIDPALPADLLIRATDVEALLPVEVGDYTDFYSSREHAENVGRLFRGPDQALLPNWRHVPIAYHGRASSIIMTGAPVHRPAGQFLLAGADAPVFGPTRELDFELELGFIVGPGNALGRPISVEEAAGHIFGVVLVNDWSARDIQRWEYRPLGPFLGKSFATSISAWVLPLAALEPFRRPGPVQSPEPLPYLRGAGDWALDIYLEAQLQTERMTAAGEPPVTITRSNARHLYWNICQQVAHHTSNGCNLRPGDLLATGTISGPTPGSAGSLLELTQDAARPLTLPSGETRTFLEDGDRLILKGWCEGDGLRLALGEVSGRILPAAAAG